MKQMTIQSLRLFVTLSILTGVFYPVVVTVAATLVFPHRAGGSLLLRDTTVIGSELIGQQFTDERYFHSRPSSIGYNPLPSSGTNWGPTDARLADSVRQRKRDFIRVYGLPENSAVPAEMLFASASGVDPHISPEAALLQVNRVVRMRGLDQTHLELIRSLVLSTVEHRQCGVFGEPRVNVLRLNLALDAQFTVSNR